MDIVIASTEADGQAAEAVEQHHAEMAGALAARVEALVGAAAGGDKTAAETARADLAGWCERELVPHALAEERTMYPAAQAKPEGRLLVEGMLGEHRTIVGLVQLVATTADPVRAAAAAKALQVAFESHLAKENELVLPLLVSAPDVSVAQLLGGMHELLGAGEEQGRGHGGAAHDHGDAAHARGDESGTAAGPHHSGQEGREGHVCGCGEVDGPGYPELDARQVPHAIRHATIFGALDAVRPGGGMVLVAPHDPLPLLAQIEQRNPGIFQVSYVERGPEAWRLLFVRAA